MKRHGQVSPAPARDAGYAMAVLLVSMSVAAVLLTAAMPVWKQMATREKEEELVFRGQQYVRALRLFGTKYANASPPNLDVLVEQRFLRKKFKDPITNDDFQALLAGQNVPGAGTNAQQGAQTGRGANDGRGGPLPAATAPQSGRGGTTGLGFSAIGTPGAGGTGGVIGVASKSKDKSIRLYNGRNHYNEWAFINTPQNQAPGTGAGGVGAPGQRGRGGQPTQPGQSPFGPGPLGPGQRGRQGPGGPGGPGGRFGPGGGSQFPQSPFQPAPPVQPIQPGRGRGGA